MFEGIARYPILFFMACTIAISGAKAEDALDPLFHPGTRYMRENVESENIAHWVGSVGVQFLGISSEVAQQKVLSEVLYLGSASNTDLKIHGFPNEMFESSSIDIATRMLFLEFDSGTETQISDGMLNIAELGNLSLEKSNPKIRSIFDQGLIKQSDGCYARWATNSENVIEAIVIASTTAISHDKRQQCLWGLVPSAFGISTLMSKYDAAKAVGKTVAGDAVVFFDRSEFVLELSAAAICREELGDFGYKCPFLVIRDVFANHAYMAPWTVN